MGNMALGSLYGIIHLLFYHYNAKMFGKPYGIPNIFVNFAVEYQSII